MQNNTLVPRYTFVDVTFIWESDHNEGYAAHMCTPRNFFVSCYQKWRNGETLALTLLSFPVCVLAFCTAGHYSTNGGVEPCVPCPMGTYQERVQQTQCSACPAGTRTAGTGSASQKDCLCKYHAREIVLGKHAFQTGHHFFCQEQNMWFTREMIFFLLNIENFRKLGN